MIFFCIFRWKDNKEDEEEEEEDNKEDEVEEADNKEDKDNKEDEEDKEENEEEDDDTIPSLHCCVGHTARAPEGREGRYQAGSKGPKPRRLLISEKPFANMNKCCRNINLTNTIQTPEKYLTNIAIQTQKTMKRGQRSESNLSIAALLIVSPQSSSEKIWSLSSEKICSHPQK